MYKTAIESLRLILKDGYKLDYSSLSNIKGEPDDLSELCCKLSRESILGPLILCIRCKGARPFDVASISYSNGFEQVFESIPDEQVTLSDLKTIKQGLEGSDLEAIFHEGLIIISNNKSYLDEYPKKRNALSTLLKLPKHQAYITLPNSWVNAKILNYNLMRALGPSHLLKLITELKNRECEQSNKSFTVRVSADPNRPFSPDDQVHVLASIRKAFNQFKHNSKEITPWGLSLDIALKETSIIQILTTSITITYEF